MKLKQGSKRQTLSNKYMVEKKIKNHKRKVRKAAKGANLHKHPRKDIGIPNSWPFKAEMLREIQRKKELEAAQKVRERAEKREARRRLGDAEMNGEDDAPELTDLNEYEALKNKAEMASNTYELKTTEEASAPNAYASSTSMYYKELRKVIEMSDVLIEVLDARYPESCRNEAIEKAVINEGKKLILLLNKIDLVPKSASDAWMSHFRQSHPCVLFKSALSHSSRPISLVRGKSSAMTPSELSVSSHVIGASDLINIIKNYTRSGASSMSKSSLTVGVIGVPNVGKSSVINSLCRNIGGAKAGGEAGVTKKLQEIQLDKKIKLVDSPGVVMNDNESEAEMVLRNVVKLSNVKDPVGVVEYLINCSSVETIMQLFKVPFFSSYSEFLGHIARLRGKLQKGGTPDLQSSAVTVLTEWTSGKIQHFTLPPSEDDEGMKEEGGDGASVRGPRIVSQLTKAFDIDSLVSNK